MFECHIRPQLLFKHQCLRSMEFHAVVKDDKQWMTCLSFSSNMNYICRNVMKCVDFPASVRGLQ